jgi:hypothetical protein
MSIKIQRPSPRGRRNPPTDPFLPEHIIPEFVAVCFKAQRRLAVSLAACGRYAQAT